MSTHPATTPDSATVEAVLETLRQANSPQTAAQLRKVLTIPKPPAAAKLGTLLEAQVAEGTVARFDPLTGKTPRYWVPGRDEHEAIVARAIEALKAAEGPRTAAELLRALPGAGIKAPKLGELLEGQARAGTLHRFDPATAKGAPRFSDRRHEHFERQALVKALAKGEAAKKPLTFAQLHKALKGTTEDRASELLQDLLDAGEAHAALKFDPRKPDQYVTKPPDLGAYLEADLAAIYARFARAGVSRERVDEAIRAYYLGFPTAEPVPPPVYEAQRPAYTAEDLAPAVLEVFEELRREKHGHTGHVPIPEIRREVARRLGPEAARHDVLDGVIKQLARERLRLLPINDATGVPAEAFEGAIRGNNVTWFYLESKS